MNVSAKVFALFLITSSLNACGSLSDALSTNDLGVVAPTSSIAHSLNVGEVTGQTWLRNNYAFTNGDFSDGLEAALKKHGVLAPEDTPPALVVDVKLTYLGPETFAPDLSMPYATFNNMTVELDADYVVHKPDDNVKLLDVIIHSTHFTEATTANFFTEAMFEGSAGIQQRATTANIYATRDNITEFLKAFDDWASPK